MGPRTKELPRPSGVRLPGKIPILEFTAENSHCLFERVLSLNLFVPSGWCVLVASCVCARRSVLCDWVLLVCLRFIPYLSISVSLHSASVKRVLCSFACVASSGLALTCLVLWLSFCSQRVTVRGAHLPTSLSRALLDGSGQRPTDTVDHTSTETSLLNSVFLRILVSSPSHGCSSVHTPSHHLSFIQRRVVASPEQACILQYIQVRLRIHQVGLTSDTQLSHMLPQSRFAV